MKRWTLILTLAVSVILIMVALPAAAQEGGDQGGDKSQPGGDFSESAQRGAVVYAAHCQACHGPTGEAIGTGPAFAAINYDPDSARETIMAGEDTNLEDGVAMPPYSAVLDAEALDDLIAYLETWRSGAVPPLPEPRLHDVPEHVPDYFGDPHEGAVIYARFCSGCHGPEGEGRDKPKVPALELNVNTLDIVANGHPNVYMPAFGAESGGPLNDSQLTDLETYMASWSLGGDESEADSGVNVLIVVMGAAAILAVGGVYLARRDEPNAG
jgi:mono/diheme cytochrome c family protein